LAIHDSRFSILIKSLTFPVVYGVRLLLSLAVNQAF